MTASVISAPRHVQIDGVWRHMAGWKPDHHDPRDCMLTPAPAASLPRKASVRAIYAPPIRDQGELGSCTANAGCEAAGFISHIETGNGDPLFSRLDLYAMTRQLEGTPLSEDSGCQVRDVFKAMSRFGVCLENSWPYLVEKFSMSPSRAAVIEALKHKAISYNSCPTLGAIKTAIALGSVTCKSPTPVIGGFMCFESLQSEAVSKTGDIPLPAAGEQQIGGHCIYFDGYDDDADDGCGGKGMLDLRNSWGLIWGIDGCGRLPYAYVSRALATDFWQLKKNVPA